MERIWRYKSAHARRGSNQIHWRCNIAFQLLKEIVTIRSHVTTDRKYFTYDVCHTGRDLRKQTTKDDQMSIVKDVEFVVFEIVWKLILRAKLDIKNLTFETFRISTLVTISKIVPNLRSAEPDVTNLPAICSFWNFSHPRRPH